MATNLQVLFNKEAADIAANGGVIKTIQQILVNHTSAIATLNTLIANIQSVLAGNNNTTSSSSSSINPTITPAPTNLP